VIHDKATLTGYTLRNRLEPLPHECLLEDAMKAIAEIQVIPIGAGVSVREPVKRAHFLLEESGLEVHLHANGTNIEGDLTAILHAIETVVETLHAEGTVRLSTHIKIGTRTDKEPTMAGKLF
jgi:uncharacterized protein (TIGR00106 family)